MTLQEFLEKYRYNPQTDLINEGGFGKIYRAWGEHDREVAIKVCQVQNHKYTLKREFEIASKLVKHPNIAFYEAVYEFDVPGVGMMEYAVMQFYPDGDLRKVINMHQLTTTEKKEILQGILEGLKFLHDSGMIHRDLKPGNILMQKVQGKWRPKITDFGLGKFFKGEGEISNTSAGIVSLLYASPEQILGKPTLPNTDLWPIGIITYLLFTGKIPFESEYPKETESFRADLSKKIVAGKIPDDIESLPQPFRMISKRCLEVNNTCRVQSANDLLKILDKDFVEKCSCGAELNKGAKFCTVCGKPVAAPQPVNAAPPVFNEEKTQIETPVNTPPPAQKPVTPPVQTPVPPHYQPAQQNQQPPVYPPQPNPLQPRQYTAATPVPPMAYRNMQKKGMPAIVWVLIIVFALGGIFITAYALSGGFKKSSSSKYTSSSSSDNDDSDYEDPFEGMSDYDINAKGEDYYNSKKYAKAKEYFEEAAGNGYTPAVRNLGIYYLAYEADYNMAFKKLTRAANEGDEDAITNLINMYENGQVYGYVDDADADYWYSILYETNTDY